MAGRANGREVGLSDVRVMTTSEMNYAKLLGSTCLLQTSLYFADPHNDLMFTITFL